MITHDESLQNDKRQSCKGQKAKYAKLNTHLHVPVFRKERTFAFPLGEEGLNLLSANEDAEILTFTCPTRIRTIRKIHTRIIHLIACRTRSSQSMAQWLH